MAEREEYRVPSLAEPLSHYTDAVRYGDLLFISGCAPINEDGRLVGPGDVAAQARQVLENLASALHFSGGEFSDILKVTVFLLNIDDRQAINPVRKEFFGDSRPASTLIGVNQLAVPDMLIEIEAVAALRR